MSKPSLTLRAPNPIDGATMSMVRRGTPLAVLLLLFGCAQWVWSQPTQRAISQTNPAGQMPPLLYVKLIGPKGMKVSFQRSNAPEQSFQVPCTVGIRPGYCVRLAISGIPEFPGATFFPTLEARGSLFLNNNARNADFPAALVFHAEDFARIQGGATLKKIVVLERPDTAIPVATQPDEPFEFGIPANRDPLQEAFSRGHPLLVLHMGQRELTREELTLAPGTILLPGERFLPTPGMPPCIPWNCFPVIDPRAGPIDCDDYFCVPDGGDVGLQAGFDRQGKLRGLDPSDTVAEYSDSRGRRRLAVSNRICLCIPRFIVLRTETGLANQVALFGPGAMRSVNGYAGFKSNLPPLEINQKAQPEKVGTLLKASGTTQFLGTAVTGRIDNLVVVGTVAGTKGIDSACLPAPEPKDGPLLIIKWPDRFGALVGDIVTFTLKYTNTGGQPITNVVVSDSLTNRFEYVPGTSKTDREAIFTSQPNEVGSQILRWQVTGTLQPRETGVVTFQVRVR
jgi:uncharacterized repeat protein (TIGR01451 family)